MTTRTIAEVAADLRLSPRRLRSLVVENGLLPDGAGLDREMHGSFVPESCVMTADAKVVPMKAHPIPDAALDDRLAFIGASGSGKTYNAGTAVERLLASGAILSRPQAAIVDALPDDGSPISREDLGAATGYSPTSGGFNNLLGSLRSLAVIDYPQPGMVAVEAWVWS